MQNHAISEKKRVTIEELFCKVVMEFFVKNLTRKLEKDLTTYLTTKKCNNVFIHLLSLNCYGSAT